MKVDITRYTFNASKHFSRVLMQQGRVQLDADWNEQVAILLYYLQTLAADLTGPHAGPAGEHLGFAIIPDVNGSFSIGSGRYYVNGIICENDLLLGEAGEPIPLPYTDQPGYPFPDAAKLEAGPTYLVYLDVWERHITHIEDDNIREVALGGPDTATRAKVVWQVKVLQTESDELDQLELEQIAEHPIEQQRVLLQLALLALTEKLKSTTGETEKSDLQDKIERFKNTLAALSQVRLRARARLDQPTEDPCITPPEARYRGAENQLYRVEVHKEGPAWNGQVEDGNPAGNVGEAATFKWSRDNGSVVFPVRELAATTEGETTTTSVTLDHLGRDSRFGLQEGDWVEIVDDDYVLQGRAEALLKVASVDRVSMQVTLDGTPDSQVRQGPLKHPLLRRWDHRAGDRSEGGLTLQDGAALILEGKGRRNWLILEDGVQIQFQKPDEGQGEQEEQSENQYRTGDYWLIPARTATGNVEWPGPMDAPEAVPPHGVEHHYAPLAVISVSGESVEVVRECRYQFELSRTLVPQAGGR